MNANAAPKVPRFGRGLPACVVRVGEVNDSKLQCECEGVAKMVA